MKENETDLVVCYCLKEKTIFPPAMNYIRTNLMFEPMDDFGPDELDKKHKFHVDIEDYLEIEMIL